MRDTTLKSMTTKRKPLKPSGPVSWKPDAGQRKAVTWLLEHPAAALFLDPGLGKTSITYAAIKVLKNQKLFKGAVVVAPLRPATSVWPQERDKWLEFNGLDVVVLHGKDKERLVQEKHDVYVVNYEGLAWLIKNNHLRYLFKRGWLDTLVFDELSRMKNASIKMKRRSLVDPWLARFDRRWGLTGSPAANGLMNIFGQTYTLDLGHAFGPYITHFRAYFFSPVGDYGWTLKDGAEELIYARVANLALRMDAEDYMRLPAVTSVTVKIELPDSVRAQYDQMEEEMLAMIDQDLVTAGTAATVSGKCRQIASGALYKSLVDPITGEPRVQRGGKREWYKLHDEKLDALEELLGELQGHQLLVGYDYGHDLQRIQHRFGKDTPYIGSGVSVKQARRYEDMWNAGDIPMLCGHPASMGHGLNLQGSNAHHVCWFTTTWDYENYDQFIRRLRRRGNKAQRMFVYHIVARNTVEDGAVLPSLNRKRNGQNALFAALKEYAKTARAGRLRL